MNLLVYTEQITPRLTWILKEILGRRLGLDYLVIDEREAYRHGSVPGITYAREAVGRRFELVMVPAGLLGERGVTPAPPPAVHSGEVPLLYPQQKAGSLPLDIFSAAFYMLSRYEEYLDFPSDAMGRFPAQESLAWRGGWLDVPVVDRWAALLAERLKEQFGMKLPAAVSRVVPTFDVDQAFAYRNKPWWRLVGGGVRAGDLWERWRVWRGRKTDPYDTFREIIGLHREGGLRPLFFFHTGQWGRYDKSIPLKKKEMQEVVRLCVSQAEVGLHPSVRSAHDPALIAHEKVRLEEAAGREVVKSRMHYLMYRFPEIPRALLAAGIREDYTLGFPEMPGFRAGTAHPFSWYDLEREEETPLLFVPLTVMDGALRTGLKAHAEEVPSYLEHYRKKTEAQGGLFVTLWHNHTFAGSDEWLGWGEAYRRWIKNLKE
jgi:hypothetical protein